MFTLITQQPHNRPIALGDLKEEPSKLTVDTTDHLREWDLQKGSRNLKERTAAKVVELGRYSTAELLKLREQKFKDKAVRSALETLIAYRQKK